MKQSLVLIISIIMLSCNSGDKQITIDSNEKSDNTTKVRETSTDQNSQKVVEAKTLKKSNVVKLDAEAFKLNVFDYTKNTEWVFNHKLPVIVDFYADWCKPCKIIEPILDKLSVKYEGKIKIYKVNTDEQREIASAFGIKGLPSILFCPINGEPQMSQGVIPKETFEQIIEDILLK